MIEKIIHQIWLQGEINIPNKYYRNIESVKKFHNSWQYMLWDEIKIIKLILTKKEWTDIYYKFIYIHQKIDFAKYIILYTYGGIYIDIDIEVIKSFDNLIEKNNKYDLIISKSNVNAYESFIATRSVNIYNNGIIIAKKNSKTLLLLINTIIKKFYLPILEPKVLTINYTTGPYIFTDVISKNEDNVKILDSEYLEPCLIDNCTITSNTISIHKHELSWMPENLITIFNFYLKNKLTVIGLICLILILIIYNFKKNL
jgi:mannosyltransferase OCH1-like enzyme